MRERPNEDELVLMNESATVAPEKEEDIVGMGKWIYVIAIPLLLIGSSIQTVRYWGADWFITSTFPPIVPLFMALALILINPLARLFKSKFRLRTQDLVITWVLGEIIASVGGYGFFSNWFSITVRMKWMQMVNPDYEPYLSRFSSWLYVDDEEALMRLVGGGVPVPWGAWIKPMITWAIFYIALMAVVISASALVRRRWTDQEHLTYGYARANLAVFELVERPKWYKNPLLWLGIIVYTIIHGGWIQSYLPWWPQLIDIYAPARLRGIYGDSVLKSNPALFTAFARWGSLRLDSFPVLWFAPIDFLLSTWVFELLRGVITYILLSLGLYGLQPGNYMSRKSVIDIPIVFSGVIGIGITYLWNMKTELKEIWKKVKGMTSTYDDDSKEPLPINWTFWSLVGGTAVIVFYMIFFFKISLPLVLFNTLLFTCFIITISRLAAETGILWGMLASLGQKPGIQWLGQMVDVTKWGVNNVMGQSIVDHIHDSHMSCLSQRILFGWKMGDGSDIDRRTFTKVICAAFILGILGSYFITLPMFYKSGYYPDEYRMRYALTVMDSQVLPWAVGIRSTLQVTNKYVTISSIVSLVVILGVAYARRVYALFPFHPLGVWLGTCYAGRWYLEGCFIIWLIKTIVFRYGGVKTYKKITPFFIGIFTGTAIHSLASYIASVMKVWLR